MTKRARPIVVVSGLLILLIHFSASVAEPAADNEEKQLQRRVEDLEKLVVKDPNHPQETVLARLAALETRLNEAQKSDESVSKSRQRQDETMTQSLGDLQKITTQLDRRLKATEAQIRREGNETPDAEIASLKRSLEQVAKVVDDLKDRVKRLESKR